MATISRHTVKTTMVTMMTPVETTPITTGKTLTRDAVGRRNINSCIARTVRHVTHTWWMRSSGGSDTE